MTERGFEVVVLGGGPAGELCAGRLGEAGLDVALVERELVGGECSYWACMPSKALLRPGEALAEARRVPGASEAITGDLDAEAVLHRRDAIVHRLDDSDQEPWLEERNITLVRGHGRLDGPRRVRVGDETLVATEAVVVAVGTGALMPPIPGLADATPWTNREATTADRVPHSLLVLGGGVVGVELAQAWSSLGSRVTLIELFDRLLIREEPFAGEQVAESLRERGVDVRTRSQAVAVERRDGVVTVELEGGERLSGEELLVAIGRRPLTDDLGLETVGLEPGEPIAVDDHMRAENGDGLYAIGDVNGHALLTHMGKYQARLVARHILGEPVRVARSAHGALAPRVVFTDPQVAAVGHTLESAAKAGLPVVAADHPTSGSAGASFYGRGAAGTSRLVVDGERGLVVGATFVGPEVAELVHAATIAIVGQVPVKRLAHAVPAFPTRSEVWVRLLEKYEQQRSRSLAADASA